MTVNREHLETLIIAPSWVGDTVMTQPLLARLLEREPNSRITVMAPSWSRGLLERMPEVAAVLDNPFAHGALRLGERRRLGRSLRGQFQRCYVLPNSLKSALLPWFASIPQRIGYVGECRYGLLNDARKLDKAALPLMVERFTALAEPRGSTLSRPVANPRLLSTPEQQQAVRAKLGLDRQRPALALCPGAEFGPAKRWPASHFAELAQAVQAQGWQVWLLGSAKDSHIAETVRKQCAAAYNLCGHTSLADAIDLLALARHVVSNDSGLMHVAAAVGTPLTAIYGSSSPGFTPPLSALAVVESLNLSCSPCFKRECPLGHTHCLVQLRPERVLRHIGVA